MSTNSPGLVAESLCRSFGEGAQRVEVLRKVSFQVRSGEVVLLMGPSGSGKSTLLSVLSGLLRPDAGRVLALGVDLWQLTDLQRRRFRLAHFGFIFQGHNLFPGLTVGQQLEMVLCWGNDLKPAQARSRVRTMLEVVDLANMEQRFPEQLSGGERQRVAVARALLRLPDICFADEPTASLDWAHGRQVVQMLAEGTRQRGATVLIVTHDARILPFANRVFDLDDGRLGERLRAGEQPWSSAFAMP